MRLSPDKHEDFDTTEACGGGDEGEGQSCLPLFLLGLGPGPGTNVDRPLLSKMTRTNCLMTSTPTTKATRASIRDSMHGSTWSSTLIPDRKQQPSMILIAKTDQHLLVSRIAKLASVGLREKIGGLPSFPSLHEIIEQDSSLRSDTTYKIVFLHASVDPYETKVCSKYNISLDSVKINKYVKLLLHNAYSKP